MKRMRGWRFDAQFESEFAGPAVAEFDHLVELPPGVDVQQRKRQRGRMERLARQVQHHRGVLADRVEHHRTLALHHGLAEDVDAFGFEFLEVGFHRKGCRGQGAGGRVQGDP